jgi:hypothetical protein
MCAPSSSASPDSSCSLSIRRVLGRASRFPNSSQFRKSGLVLLAALKSGNPSVDRRIRLRRVLLRSDHMTAGATRAQPPARTGAGCRRPDRLNLNLVPSHTEGYDAVRDTPRMSIVSLPCCCPWVTAARLADDQNPLHRINHDTLLAELCTA